MKYAPKDVKVNCPGCPPRIKPIDTSNLNFSFTAPKEDDTRKVTVVNTSQYKKKFGDTKQNSLF